MKKPTEEKIKRHYQIDCWKCVGKGTILTELKRPGYRSNFCQTKCPSCKGKGVVNNTGGVNQ